MVVYVNLNERELYDERHLYQKLFQLLNARTLQIWCLFYVILA